VSYYGDSMSPKKKKKGGSKEVQEPVLFGFLMKRSDGYTRMWQSRYFELMAASADEDYATLRYRRAKFDHIDSDNANNISMEGATVKMEGDILHLTATRHYELKACPGDLPVTTWYKAIMECIQGKEKLDFMLRRKHEADKASQIRETGKIKSAMERAKMLDAVKHAEHRARLKRELARGNAQPQHGPEEPAPYVATGAPLRQSQLQEYGEEDLTVTESYDETTDDDEAEISEDEAELEAPAMTPATYMAMKSVKSTPGLKKIEDVISAMKILQVKETQEDYDGDDDEMKTLLAQAREAIEAFEAEQAASGDASADGTTAKRGCGCAIA